MLDVKGGLLQRLLRIAVVAAIYYFAARLGLMLQLGHTNASPVWPPSGIAFATLIILGPEMWPGIMLGAFIANVTVFYANHVAGIPVILFMSAGIAVGNTLEATTGYYLLKRFGSTEILGKASHFGLFFGAALFMCFISSMMGTLFLAVNKIISWADYSSVWFTWWTGDVSGVVILTPVLLAWWKPRRRKWGTASIAQVIILSVTLVVYLGAVFGGWLPLGLSKAKIFFIFFIITWCVFCMSQRQLSLVIMAIAVFSIYSTYKNEGPFIDASPNLSFISLQVFLCVIATSMMFLSTTLNERRQREEELFEANANLEIKVIERTRAIEQQKQELFRKTKDLETANRESRSFAHVVSHDLREPLRSITSYIQLLEERYGSKLDEEGLSFMSFAVDGAKRMNSLIEDLLAYTRIEHAKEELTTVNLSDIVVLIKNNLNTAIRQNDAQIVVDTDLPELHANHSQMMQLFQNIIDNAIKYHGDLKPEIHISATHKDHTYIIAISDNGIGIAKEHYERIFVIFQRLHTRSHYEGTGIGLAICKRIMEKHDGKIWVESELGKGSTFYMAFKE